MKNFQRILKAAKHEIGRVDGIIGPKTLKGATKWAMLRYSFEEWEWHDKDLIWIRTSSEFDDKFTGYCLTVSLGKVIRISNATTLPGNYWVKNPLTVGGITGTGVIKEGQQLGTHKWISEGKKKWGGRKAGYAKQMETMLIYRDGDKDNTLDRNIIQKAPSWYGFQMHAMGRGFKIWNWSAGCLGVPLQQWLTNVVPFFKDGDIINKNIIQL